MAEISLGRPDWLWQCAAVLGVAFLVLAFRYARARGMPAWARAGSIGLKLCGIALLCACLVDVRWTDERPESGANLFLVLADGSRGMHQRDAGGGMTRAEAVSQALRRGDADAGAGEIGTAAGWQKSLEGDFQVRRYIFGERLESVPSHEGMVFDEASSDLGHALKVLGERYRKRPVAGVFVFSDGNATDLASVEDLESVVTEEGIPVFPVVVGGEEPVTDLAIVDTRVSQTVFEDAPVTVEADVQCAGYDGKSVLLELIDEEGKVVQKERHTVSGADESHRFRIRLKPLKTGVLFYTLRLAEERKGESIPADSEEATLENNERVVLVDRARGPYRVLYVTGRPNWEYKFLRRALQPDSQIEMVGLIRVAKREPKFQWRGRAGESSNPLFRGFGNEDPEEGPSYDKPVLVRLNARDEEEMSGGFPRTASTLFADYHAIIVDDLEAGFFTRDQMDLIEDFVSRRGGGFLMLGGQESFRGGGYENTPVAQMLPVYLDRVGAAPESTGNLRWDLTREGWLEPWLRLRDLEDQERDRVEAMPDFRVVNQLRAIKPGASVLAMVSDFDGRSFPAIVGQRYGEGRVLSIPLGDVWRWGFRNEELHEDMEKAWRQTIRWLIADVPERMAFASVRDEGGGRRINLELRLVDEEFVPQDNAMVTFAITDDEGKEFELTGEPSMEEAGLYEAPFSGRREGIYRAVATVKDENGKLLGNPATGWTVDLASEEFRDLRPNRKLMEDLASATGGEVLELDALEAFVDDLQNREAPMMTVTSEPLWHAPWVFLAALVCFASEWGLRRRYGLA